MTAYCLKCRERREIKDPQKVITSTGKSATDGECPVCGIVVLNEDRS